MAYKYVEDLREHRVFYHFLEISKIPRQTFFEKEISDHLHFVLATPTID